MDGWMDGWMESHYECTGRRRRALALILPHALRHSECYMCICLVIDPRGTVGRSVGRLVGWSQIKKTSVPAAITRSAIITSLTAGKNIV